MNKKIEEIKNFIEDFVKNNNKKTAKQIKEEIEKEFGKKFNIEKNRSLWIFSDFVIRFSSVENEKNGGNTICSFKKIIKYDYIPCICCVIRPQKVDFFLMNLSFVKKISHSSIRLIKDKIRGSINLPDILKIYQDIPNSFNNFNKLFFIHKNQNKNNNIERIIGNTENVVSNKIKFNPTDEEKIKIIKAIYLSKEISDSEQYKNIDYQLKEEIKYKKMSIIQCAKENNTKNRGDSIEKIITGTEIDHDICDFEKTFYYNLNEIHLGIGLKTRTLSGKNSSPCLYNIDKMLRYLSIDYNLFSLFMIRINIEEEKIDSVLISIFDQIILKKTMINPHWASKNSRGHAQLSHKNCQSIYNYDFKEKIDIDIAKEYIEKLLVTV